MPARVWSEKYQHHESILFEAPRLPRAPPAAATSALDFFSLFFTADFLQHIVTLTNEYARERFAVPPRGVDEEADDEAADRAATTWVDTSAEEVKALLGCLIYMSLVQMDGIATVTVDFWAAATQQPFVTAAFSRTRFFALLRNLRVNAPEDPDAEGEDRLAKLRQMLNMIEGNMLRYFYPKRDLSVDEAMILFKGRNAMRQHIERKACPTGFKV